MSNNIGQVRPSLSAPQGTAPYSGAHVTEANSQEEFEKSLDAPSGATDVKKSAWDAANQKEFSMLTFQSAHGHSMAHDARMKEIYDSMNDGDKSNKHRRQG